MYLKTDRNDAAKRSWSLASILTIYYAVSAFAIVALATGYLYWVMRRNVDLEDDRLLGDVVRRLHAVLSETSRDKNTLQQQVELSTLAGQNARLFVRVLNEEGATVVESANMEVIPASVFPPPTEEPRTGTNVSSKEGRTVRILGARVPIGNTASSYWTLQVAMDRAPEDEILDDYLANLSYVLVTAIVVCTVAGFLIARRGLMPLRAIITTATSIQPDNLAERISLDGLPSELRELAGTFNAMLDRLENAFTRLSRFSADIAHELRTPINNLRGEIDVALQRKRSAAEYEDVLGSCIEECDRLTVMIEGLLFLAWAENQKPLPRESIHLAQELGKVRDFFEAIASEAHIEIAVEAEESLTAQINRTLVQRAVANLVANALRYTPANGKITLRASKAVDDVQIEVADTGRGIPTKHLPYVFDRCYRADPSESGGFGLGLAIVKSIAELHGGRVLLESTEGQGTTVKITLPHRSK